jgi:hypothetical protein
MPARAALSMIVASLMAQAYATALDGGALVLYDDTTAAPATPETRCPWTRSNSRAFRCRA